MHIISKSVSLYNRRLIDQFRYIKIHPKTTDLSMRL